MSKARSKVVSETLRAAIKNSGLSLNELARKTGVSVPVLSRFMRGERSITVDTLDQLAPHLGLKLASKQDRI